MWKHIAARTTGVSHLRQDQPCQDRFACEQLDDGWFIAAVADGAGSAPYAEVGAQLAVEVALAVCGASIARSLSPQASVELAFQEARGAIIRHAEDAAASPREFATTLLLVVMGTNGGAAGQIGDGLIAVKADEDGWTWVFWPQRGEYANVTLFLSDADALSNLQVAALDGDVREVGLMTDGLEPLALHYASKTVHDPFFEGMMPSLRLAQSSEELGRLSSSLEAFLASPRVSERADDDLTLVLAARS